MSGTVFLDVNADGVRQPAELGLNGFGVFIDTNGNGTFDGADVRVFTNTQGQFTLGSLAPGIYAIQETVPTGYTLTTAAFPRTVTVTADQGVTVDIGYRFA